MERPRDDDPIFNITPWVSSCVIVSLYILVIYAKHEILITDEILLNEYKGNDFDNYLEATNNFRKVKYFFLTLGFIITIGITFASVSVAKWILGLNSSSRIIFNIALLACSVEIIKELYIFCWFQTQDYFISSEVFNFYPLSFFSVASDENSSFARSFALQAIDLFFLLKTLIIICSLIMLRKNATVETIRTVCLTYVLPLLVFYAMVYMVI
jgi:hypothetical protein